MERITGINAARIRWCCDDFGIDPDGVAEQLHIAPETMSAVLASEDGLTFNQLRRLADFFGRGVLFFLEHGNATESSVRTPQFRSLSNEAAEMSPELKRLVERAERHRVIYLSLREEVGLDDQTTFDVSAFSKQPAEAAAKAREWLGLGNNPNETREFTRYRDAVEARGVLVLRSQGYSGAWQFPKGSKVIGLSLFYEVCPLIVVRKLDNDRRQTFTLMHELGHLLLHRRSSIDVENNLWSQAGLERDANSFAGHVLVPTAFLQMIRGAAPRTVFEYDEWLRVARNTWGVSTEVILRRLLDEGRLRREEYEAYRKWKAEQPLPPAAENGVRLYRHREPIHIFGQRYVRTVLDALGGNYISLSKASGFLDNLKVRDVRRLEKHIAGV